MENYSSNSTTSQAQQNKKALENPYYRSRTDIMNTIMYGDSNATESKNITPAPIKKEVKMQTASSSASTPTRIKSMPKSSKTPMGAKMTTKSTTASNATVAATKLTNSDKTVNFSTTTTFSASMSKPIVELSDKEFLDAYDVPVNGFKSKVSTNRKATKQTNLLIDAIVFITLIISLYLTIGSFGLGVVPAIVLSLAGSTLISVITFFLMRKGESRLFYISLFLVYACVMGGIAAILRASFLTHLSFVRVYLWTCGGSITMLVGLAEIINGVSALFTSSNVKQLQKITKN
jgi:hypothetical protein